MKLHKGISTTNDHVGEFLIKTPHCVKALKIKRPERLKNQCLKPSMILFHEIALKLSQEEST